MASTPIEPAFTDEFLLSLPADEDRALLKLCERFDDWWGSKASGKPQDHLDELSVAVGVLRTVVGARSDGASVGAPSAGFEAHQKIKKDFDTFHEHARKRLNERLADGEAERTKLLLPGAVYYDIPPDDVDKVHALIRRIREIVTGSDDFAGRHRNRVLKSVDRLERDVAIRMSNLDRFYGVVADIRDALALGGSWAWENRHAIFEAGNELITIAERARNLFLGLPTGATDLPLMPRLPEPKADE